MSLAPLLVLALAFARTQHAEPAAPAPDAATPIPVDMTWNVDEAACDVRAQLERRGEIGLVDDVHDRRHADITITPVSPTQVRVEIVLEVDGVVVERTLEAGTCALAANVAMLVVGAYLRALDRAAPVVAAVPVDDPVGTNTTNTPSTPSTVTTTTTTTTAPVPAASRAPRRERGTWWLGAIGGASFGPLPLPSGALGLVAAWQHAGLLRVQLEASHVFRRTARPTSTAAATARLSAFSFALRAGVAPRWRRLRFPILLGLEVADVVGRPRGTLQDARVGQRVGIAAALDAGILWSPTDRIALGIGGALTVALLRARFEFEEQGGTSIPIPVAGRVGGRALLSVLVRLR